MIMELLEKTLGDVRPHNDLEYPNQAEYPLSMLERDKWWRERKQEEDRGVKEVVGDGKEN